MTTMRSDTIGQDSVVEHVASSARRDGGSFALVTAVVLLVALAVVAEVAPRGGARGLRPASVPASLAHEATMGPVERPAGLAVGPDGTVHVVDAEIRHVTTYTRDGVRVRDLGVAPEDGAPAPGQLGNPLGVAVDGAGTAYVSDLATGRISMFAGGRYTGEFAATSMAASGARAGMLAATPDGLLVCDIALHRVLRIGWDGAVLGVLAAPADDPLSYPNGAWADPSGRVFVSDTNHDRIVAFDASGGFEGTVARGITNPRGIVGDGRGRLYVAATLADAVFVIDARSGAIVDRVVSVRGTGLSFPTAVALDGDRLLATDRGAPGLHVWRIEGDEGVTK